MSTFRFRRSCCLLVLLLVVAGSLCCFAPSVTATTTDSAPNHQHESRVPSHPKANDGFEFEVSMEVPREQGAPVLPPGLGLGLGFGGGKSHSDSAEDASPSFPASPQTQELMAEYQEALREYYRLRTTEYQHRVRVFQWQLYSSQLIFWIVVGMVAAGILFSGLQLHQSLFPSSVFQRQMQLLRFLTAGGPSSSSSSSSMLGTKLEPTDKDSKPTSQPLLTPADFHPPSTINISTSGIQIQSPVLGLIILVVSFGFFYLYMLHVYPIRELSSIQAP